MQNRYVGDIGDYIKYALLRKLTKGYRLGVAWYLFPDEDNTDGRHTQYLCPPANWKRLSGHLFQKDPPRHWESLDSSLFRTLKSIVESERHTRFIAADSQILGGDTKFFSEVLSPPTRIAASPHCYRDRKDWRKGWFTRLRDAMDCSEVVFVDPDNGLCENEKFRYGTVKQWKRIPLKEVRWLADGDRPIVIFHHNTMRPGGHTKEIAYWIDQLGEGTVAVRAAAWGARTFFVVNPSKDMSDTLSEFCNKSAKFTLHPQHPARKRKPTERQLVTNKRRQQIFIGWDVGGWNCDNNTRSRDALVVLDDSGSEIGKPWRKNLRRTINDSSTPREFLSAVLNLCSLTSDDEIVHATIAIDAPLAFPRGFVRLIARGEALERIGDRSAENQYLFRFTERRLASAEIINPLSPIKDMIGSQATKAMHLISRLNLQRIKPGVWSDNDCLTAIETYPSFCRVRLNQTSNMNGAEGDIADARMCAQIARDYQLRPNSLESPPQNAPEAEGWIWAPLP